MRSQMTCDMIPVKIKVMVGGLAPVWYNSSVLIVERGRGSGLDMSDIDHDAE